MRSKIDLAYWIPTALVAVNWTFGGLGSLMGGEAAMEVFRSLGYPSYFASLLGAAQLMAVAAILAPVPRVLREWAYAGLSFDALAAIASLLAAGKPFAYVGFPSIALFMVLASYRAWRARLDRGSSEVATAHESQSMLAGSRKPSSW